MRSKILLLLSALGCAACGGGGGGTGGAPATLVGLNVEWTATLDDIDGVPPTDDNAYFAVVRVNITNDTASSTPVGATHFSVATSGGLEILASPTSSLLAGYCAGEVSVVAGAAHTCEVAFEVDAASKPTELKYDSGVGTKAQAAVSIDDPNQICTLYCQKLALQAGRLKCAAFDSAACNTDCKAALTKASANGCVGEVEAVNVCVLALPDSEFSCPPGLALEAPGDCGNQQSAATCL